MNEILDFAVFQSMQINNDTTKNKKSVKSLVLEISNFKKESNLNPEILKLLELVQKQFLFSKNEFKSELYKCHNDKIKRLVYSFSFHYLNNSPLFRNHYTLALKFIKKKFKSWIKKHSLKDNIIFILNAKHYQNEKPNYGFDILLQI